MSGILRTGVVFALGLVFISGTAKAWKISDLETEVAALKSRMGELEQREEKYRKEVEDVKKDSTDQVLQIRKDQADLKVEMDGMKQRLVQIEERVKQLSEQMTELQNKVQAQAEAAAQQASQATAEPASETKESGQGADIYNQALDNFNKKKYDIARAQFQAFLKTSPNDPYADNAQFWIGESYFQQKDYKRAIIEYDTVREKYPKGNKVPAALYKIGLCFDYLGKKPEAEAIYKELIESYPSAEEVSKAKAQLEKLQKTTKTTK